MPRLRDASKRSQILRAAKTLFAEAGFDATSMTSLARVAGLPVGSLYTYFPGKDAILEAIVDEGWGEFADGLSAGLAGRADAAGRVEYLVREALPALFVDVELISILVTEAGRSSRLGEKLDMLATLLSGILEGEAGSGGAIDRESVRVGVAVILLGSLDVVRLAARAPVGISQEQVVRFVAQIAATALGPPA